MTSPNKHIALTGIFNFFIIIGAGHGIGTLGLVGFIWLPSILRGEFNFVLFADYDESLAANALISIVGQTLFIIALFLKRKKYLVLAGSTLMTISFISLTHTVRFDSLASIGLVSGIPFVISLVILIKNLIITKEAI